MTTLVRFRLWLIGAFAVVNGALDGIDGSSGTDFFAFADAARRLMSSGWASTFDDPSIQVGPLALVWPAVTGWIADVTGISHPTVVAISIYLAFSLGAVLTVRFVARARGAEASPVAELAAGVGVMAAGFCWVAVSSGQPFDAVVGILWIVTAMAATRDRPAVAGTLLAAACLVKLVAILGLPLLLLVPGWRRRLTGTAWFAILVAAGLLPFVLLGDVGTFDHVWRVTSGSPMAFVVETGTEFPWPLRALQAAVVIGGGTAVVGLMRRSLDVVWVAPLALAVLRLATDPVSYDYYWLAPAAIAVVGVASMAPAAGLRTRLALVAGAYLLGMSLLLDGPWTEPARYGLTIALIAFVMARERGAFVEEAPAPV
jgi:hypothetical protein